MNPPGGTVGAGGGLRRAGSRVGSGQQRVTGLCLTGQFPQTQKSLNVFIPVLICLSVHWPEGLKALAP